MKRIQEIVMVIGLMGSWTVLVGCSKGKAPPEMDEPASNKVKTTLKKKDNSGEQSAQEVNHVKVEVVELGKFVKLEMVLIPAGKFMMGSPASEKGRSDNETQHEVTITKPYYMGKYEVTQEQWENVMGKNPTRNHKGSNLPVTDVSWSNCQEFIIRLNKNTNGVYRLPTEAEWEYACRAGTTTAYSFGDTLTKNDANIDGSRIKVIGSYEPNAFGLYDMHGNVWEFCEDWYAAYQEKSVTDPKGPATGERHVLRGGSFYNVFFARSSSRYY
ncbi:MAG: hypothetical protein RL553_2310, partial [Planctomycetota bacterium]